MILPNWLLHYRVLLKRTWADQYCWLNLCEFIHNNTYACNTQDTVVLSSSYNVVNILLCFTAGWCNAQVMDDDNTTPVHLACYKPLCVIVYELTEVEPTILIFQPMFS